MECYLDNAATTRVFPEVKDIMIQVMEEDFGNPSSKHMKGVDAEHYIKDAKEEIAKWLKVMPKEIVFTSGGTESNNMALIGAALANQRRGKHIITSGIEHASVYNPLLSLEKQGFEVTFLGVDESGKVDPKSVEEALRDDTILVSIMHVNNEIGAIQPIEEIGKIVKKKSKDIVYHVDAIQSFGKFFISPKKCNIDLLSVSGHKIHGPKGSGFIYIKDRTKVRPLILGGGQQKDMRSGTENVPAIAGLMVATKKMYDNFDVYHEHMVQIKNRLIDGLASIEDTVNHSGDAPHIVSCSFIGVRSEVLLHALEERGIYVSSGSACSSNHPGVSGVLTALHLDAAQLDSTIRFSICESTSEEEIDETIKVLKELLPVLRRFTRR